MGKGKGVGKGKERKGRQRGGRGGKAGKRRRKGKGGKGKEGKGFWAKFSSLREGLSIQFPVGLEVALLSWGTSEKQRNPIHLKIMPQKELRYGLLAHRTD